VTLPSVKTTYTRRSEPDEDQGKEVRSRGEEGARTLAYPVEFRLRVVKLFLDEGYSIGSLEDRLNCLQIDALAQFLIEEATQRRLM
jgi:hypothetical protein